MSESHDLARAATEPQTPASVRNDADETGTLPGGGAAGSALFGPPSEPGDVGKLGPYRVVKQLGKGGMGAVYLAFDTRLNRKLALKVMLPEFAAHTEAKERFLREARAAAQISHDNVVTVFEADERDGVPFIAMQYLKGYPLDEYLKKKGDPSIPQVLRIAREVAAGLAAAHALGLVHRDIKPANLWLEAPHGRVKVLDFGLARPAGANSELTRSGAVVGTPAYMSPEQARGLKVDHRTDLFSLGAVLYRLCTGRLPFDGPSVMAVLMALGTEEPKPVRELNPNVSEALAELVHKLLAKSPDHRPQTADEVVRRARAIATPGAPPVPSAPASNASQPSQPQVVYVPIQVTAVPESSSFEGLDEGEPEPAVVRSVARPKAAQPKAAGKGMWIAAGVAVLLAAVVVGGVFVATRKKDTPGSKPEVAEGAPAPRVAKPAPAVQPVKPDPEPKTEPKPKTDPEPKPPDPDRKAAGYVLGIGGLVRVNGDITDIGAAADLPRQSFILTKVWLRGNQRVTDTGLAVFKDVKDLRHLDLVATPVSDAGLAHFDGCKSLFVLDLDRARIGDAGVAHFKDCTTLTNLWLGYTNVTDAGLVNFKNCKSLFQLDLNGTAVTDDGLANFTDCRNLRNLFLADARVGDAGLAHFKNSTRLAGLHLPGTSVTDAALAQFKDYPNLAEVNVRNTKVTAAGIADLRKALPLCKIDWNGGATNPTKK